MLVLDELRIYRQTRWDYTTKQEARSLRGKITFKGNAGAVELNLDEELSQRLLAVVAEEVAAAGREVAHNLTAEIVNGTDQVGRDVSRAEYLRAVSGLGTSGEAAAAGDQCKSGTRLGVGPLT